MELTGGSCELGKVTRRVNDHHDCGPGGFAGGDIVYAFSVPDEMLVTLMAEADFDADFALTTVCDDGSAVVEQVCVDFQGTDPDISCSQIDMPDLSGVFTHVWYSEPDIYYLWIDGHDYSETGDYAVELTYATLTPTPTETPTCTPTETPTATPTETPTEAPTSTPSATPTSTPTYTPTDIPTPIPTDTPTQIPTNTPTATPPMGTLSGHVDLERPGAPAPDASWIVDLVITLCRSGTTVGTYATVTDESGDFTVDVPAGDFDILVKNSHALANKIVNVSIYEQETTPMMDFGLLAEGDANDDNFVISSDFFILRATYNKQIGQPGYDDRADFNEDDMVISTDFFLLRDHYNESGEDCGNRTVYIDPQNP